MAVVWYMSTRSSIAIKNSDGTITGICCHFDGYPSHHVPLLVGHYETPEKVAALLELGDISVLGSEIGEAHDFDAPRMHPTWCRVYGRDRGETGTEAYVYANEDEYAKSAPGVFHYLFREGKWFGRNAYTDMDTGWVPVEELLSQYQSY